ncbi:MAG TPA: N-acetyltransferase [Candidatus Lokiarchaeia archaeon]|nr:N-acetyltransferase [Candidatus Lokiarchaeia archaeon]
MKIRHAKVRDVPRMMDLINEFAREGLMLFRGPQSLFEDIRDFLVIVDDENVVRGCGAFHVLWEDVGEIRAVAVERAFQGNHYGVQLVQELIEEARELEIPRVYTFTYLPNFFKKMGFKIVRKEDLPQKMYAECSRCPKYFFCDEIAMKTEIEIPQQEASEK